MLFKICGMTNPFINSELKSKKIDRKMKNRAKTLNILQFAIKQGVMA
jgi:hypothetical protein